MGPIANKVILVLVFVCFWFGTARCQANNHPDFTNLDVALKREFASRFGFSVLIANERSVLFSRAYGSIDSSRTRMTDNQTLFNIASVTKSFTAVAIMQLAEQGRLRLSDSVGTFFRQVPADKRSITISQLLSHKSGFRQNFVCDGIVSSTDAQKALFTDTLGSVPGTGFDYSNENFELLGLVIEAVSRSSYEDFIRMNILIPLGMKNTWFWGQTDTLSNVAGKNREIEAGMRRRNWGYIGSGGIYSTPADLYLFISGVIHHKLLSAHSTAMMFTSHHQTGSGLGILSGWFMNDTTEWGGREIWTRGNEDWGHNAVIRWFPDKHYVIIVCSNSGELAGDKHNTGNRLVSNYVADYLFKK